MRPSKLLQITLGIQSILAKVYISMKYQAKIVRVVDDIDFNGPIPLASG